MMCLLPYTQVRLRRYVEMGRGALLDDDTHDIEELESY